LAVGPLSDPLAADARALHGAPAKGNYIRALTTPEDRMDQEAAFDKFKQCTVEVLQVDPDRVQPDARFGDDLDADSLDLVELVMALEESFDITVDETELEGIETVEQAFSLVTSKL
jgi:acyl carrier protein